MTNIRQEYEKYYRALGFERRGLFAQIQKAYHPQYVLYPGSSIHITPSFYFPHLIYIDSSPRARAFFAQPEAIQTLIQENQTYKKRAYFQFLAADFNQDLGLRLESYDLLLSIFSGQMIQACQKYIKPQGLILTTSLFSDHKALAQKPAFELEAWLNCRLGSYHLHQNKQPPKPQTSGFKGKDKSLTYVDREIYYLYRKK